MPEEESAIHDHPVGVAQLSVSYAEDGHPLDARICQANDGYLQLIGLTRARVEGRLLTEVFGDARATDIDELAIYGKIARHGGEASFDARFTLSGKCFRVYVHQTGRDQCTAILTDITLQRDSEQALRDSEARLRLAVEIAHLGAWEWSVPDGRVYLSPQWKRLLGYAEHELPDELATWVDRLHPDDRHAAHGALQAFIAHPEGMMQSEYRILHRDGHYRWMIARAIADIGLDGRAQRLIGTMLDVTQQKMAEQRVKEAAQHDPLTGLPNRALIFEYASHLLAAASRRHSRGALLFIDLDRFKPVNDLYGHEVGDRLLHEVAQRMKSCVRHEDLIGRLGGDEFVIMLPYLGRGHSAPTVARHVIDALSSPFCFDGLELAISASVGISFYPQHGAEIDILLHRADLAMYRAKESGRASYRVFTPELGCRADESQSIETQIKESLAHQRLRLHYQPVIDIESGLPVAAEALLRLPPRDGLAVGPDRFIPVAEASGIIAQLGDWVATAICRQQAAWAREGLPPLPVAMNISPLQFRQRGFAQRLLHIVSDGGWDPSLLQLEITEGALVDRVDDAARVLEQLRGAGMCITLDDLGTGCASLAVLAGLPLDQLKVDQSFVQRLGHDRGSRAVTEAIIAMGRMMGAEVIGEGIEHPQSLDYLRRHGCRIAQGHLFSRALPADEFAAWCRRH